MDIEFVRNRITELRMKRGLSEYRLSYDLGHSKNYIHNIVTGQSLPSLKELLYLISILGVTPRDFFDENQEYSEPQLAKQVMEGIKKMDKNDLEAVLVMINRLNDPL